MESFEILYERYKSPIFGFLFHLLRDRQTAEDCTHDVFIRLYKKAGHYRAKAKFSTWLYQMARNAAIDLLRMKKLRVSAPLDAPLNELEEGGNTLADLLSHKGASPDQVVESQEAVQMIRRGILRLNDDDREIITLCDIQGLPHKEAAKVLKMRPGTVTVKLFRARRRLAAILGLKEEYL